MKISLTLRQRIECALILRNTQEGSITDWDAIEDGLKILDITEKEAKELGIDLTNPNTINLDELAKDEVEYNIPENTFLLMQEKFQTANSGRKIGKSILPLARKFLSTREIRREEKKKTKGK